MDVNHSYWAVFLALSICSCLFAVVCPSTDCLCFSLVKHCIFKLFVILTLLVLPNFMLSPSSCYNQFKYVCQLLSHLAPEGFLLVGFWFGFFFPAWLFAFSKYSSCSAAYRYCSVWSTSLSLPPCHGGLYRKLRHQRHTCGCSSGNQKHKSQAVRQACLWSWGKLRAICSTFCKYLGFLEPCLENVCVAFKAVTQCLLLTLLIGIFNCFIL